VTVTGVVTGGARLLAPSVPWVLHDVPAPRFDEAEYAVERDAWAERLGDRRPAAVLVAYDGTKAAQARMESKASGLLGAVALVSAGIVALLTSAGGGFRVAAVVALAYAVSAAYGCCAVLLPRMSLGLAPDETLSDTDGHAEMLACARLNEPFLEHAAFALRAAVRDLAYAAAITTVAVLASSAVG
jgi:hypothetical protein